MHYMIDGEMILEPNDEWMANQIVLDKEEASKINELLKKEFINQNEEPGKSAYPILKAIMEFGSES